LSFGKSVFGVNYRLAATIQLHHQGLQKNGYSDT